MKMEFDFNYWANLSPEKYEIERKKTLDALVEELGNTEQLKRVRSRIELTKQTAKNPLHSAVLSSNLMMDSFEQMRQALNGTIETKEAKILKFGKKNGN